MMYLLVVKTQFREIYRSILEIGLARFVFLVLLCLYFIYYLLSIGNVHLPVGIYALLLFVIHFSRKDHAFLRLFFRKVYKVYLLEYVLLSLPFVAITILKYDFQALVLYPIFILLIPLLSVGKQVYTNVCFPFLRKGSYEYQIGTRIYFYILIITCYLIPLLGVVFHNKNTLYFSTALAVIIVSQFNLLEVHTLYIKHYIRFKDLILAKCKNCIQNTFVVLMPIVIAGIFFESDVREVVVGAFLSALLLAIAFQMLAIAYRKQLFVTVLAHVFLLPLSICATLFPYLYIVYIFIDLALVVLVHNKIKLMLLYDTN